MAWVAVNKDGSEAIYEKYPFRDGFSHDTFWRPFYGSARIRMPRGSIKKLIGRDLTWDDEPVELKED